MMEIPGFQAGDLMLVILDTKKLRALSHQQQQHRDVDGFSTGTMLVVAVIIVALAFVCCFFMYVVLISTTKRSRASLLASQQTNQKEAVDIIINLKPGLICPSLHLLLQVHLSPKEREHCTGRTRGLREWVTANEGTTCSGREGRLLALK